ncbi:MAG: septum formation initiator family protein [Bacteroides sp.]|nr:septum formation initiator family protein [Bacteroides sp.]MCM1413016.1 septum formation initiator family protein [Bacteroides sp.]MCM1471722.1 septum formation initiator family protein [Bacteroides sp.]
MTDTTTPRRRTFMQWAHRYLFNFSLITIVAVLTYILFFTDTSVQTTYYYERQADDIQREIRLEQDSLQYYRDLNRQLASDPSTVEKEARQKYHMQRPHEDVYVIR